MKMVSVLLAVLTVLALNPESPGAETSVAASIWRAAGVTPATSDSVRQLSLPDLTGRAVGLDQHRGRVVMLYFWATW